MFDVGFSEIILIGIVALLVTDPKDLPDIMFKAGRFFRQFKIIMSRITDTVSDVMHEFEVESYRQHYKDKPDLLDADRAADNELAVPAIAHEPETPQQPEPRHE